MRNLLLVAMLLVAHTARADYSKAWSAAKANLPATTRAIAMIDLAALARTPQLARLWNVARATERDLKEIDGALKQLCRVDITRVVEGLVVAGDPEKKQVVFYLQLGIDRAKATACFEALMTTKTREKITVAQQGIYSMFTSQKKQHRAYAAWPAPNVVAFAVDVESKPALAAWVGQTGFAKSPVAPLLAKTDSKAVAAGAVALTRVFESDLPVRSGYGHALLSGDKVSALLVGTAPDAKAANKGGAALHKEIQREKERKRIAPAFRNLLNGMQVGAIGNDIRLRIAATVKDFADAIEAETVKKEKPVEQPSSP